MKIRLRAVGRGRWAATVLALVVASSAVFVITQAVSAANGSAPSKPVPEEYRAAIVEASASCPALSPARVAAQVMAESGFSPTATNGRGGRGLAGLTVDEWTSWKPWGAATRTDSRANILALAHLTCDLVGHIRVDKIDGDLWQLALGARYSGVDEVTSARAVPAAAQQYVTETVGYAADYEHDTVLSGAPSSPSVADSPSPSAQPSSPAPSASLSPGPARAAAPTTSAAAPAPAAPAPAAPAPAPPPPAGPITGPGGTGKCIDVDHNTAVSGNAVQLWDCNGVPGQQWAINADGTVRSFGKCLDIVRNGSANFTKVQLWDCNGVGGQQWRPQANGSLLNPQSGRCLDDPAAQTTNGTQLQIYDCNGRFTQVWHTAV